MSPVISMVNRASDTETHDISVEKVRGSLLFLRYAKLSVGVWTFHHFAMLVFDTCVRMPIYAPSYGDDLARSEGTINKAWFSWYRNSNRQFFLSGWRWLRLRSGVKRSDEANRRAQKKG